MVELLGIFGGDHSGLRLGLMHGRLSTDEKDAVMAAFRAGEIDVLVCTTVIEVGVDVHNATVMFVMDADRFGISQLHQAARPHRPWRARRPLPARSQTAGTIQGGTTAQGGRGHAGRIRTCGSRSRGAPRGDVLGYSQSGRPIVRFLSLFDHREIIEDAREFCQTHFEKHPADPGMALWQPNSPIPSVSSTWTSPEPRTAGRAGSGGDAGHRGRLSDGRFGAGAPHIRRAGRRCRPSHRVSTSWPEVMQIPLRIRGFDYRRAAFGDSWTDDNPAPGGHNGCDTRNDILDRDLVDKTYVSIKRCPTAVATGILHDPYTNETVAFVRGNQTGASVQIDHIVPLALAWTSEPATGPTTCRLRLPTARRTGSAVADRPIRTRSDSEPALWMPPNLAFRCQYAMGSSSRCCAAMRYRWMHRRRWCCAMPPRRARRVESDHASAESDAAKRLVAGAAVMLVALVSCSSTTSGEGTPEDKSSTRIVIDGQTRMIEGKVVCVLGPTGEVSIEVDALDAPAPGAGAT